MTVRLPPTDNPLYEIAEASEYTWYYRNTDLFTLASDDAEIELARYHNRIYLTGSGVELLDLKFKFDEYAIESELIAHIIDKIVSFS